MPALSPTMLEGKLVRWLKRPGDTIVPGDVIVEIETDKAVMEVEAVDRGTLAEIVVPEGTESVPVRTVIATLIPLSIGESTAALQPREHAPPASIPHKSAPGPRASGATKDGERVKASPLARRHAAQADIDLGTLSGTGPNGRIIKADVDEAASLPALTPSPSRPATFSVRERADLLGMSYSTKAHPSVRKVIARRLTESKQSIPHFTLAIHCRLDALFAVKSHMNALMPAAPITLNDFIIRAAALALRQVPDVNVSWADETMLLYHDVDISVAVNSPSGLVTPVIKRADTKPLPEISQEMRELASRARTVGLKPHEYEGGTFSVSNLGASVVREFSAIINPPQSCILAIGRSEKRAVVENDHLAIATMITCTLSVDHRAIDGVLAADFLSVFKTLIENPYTLSGPATGAANRS
jgi:pyruvate dehydrogenase E2 component (dihydrolipoamide acetyltransferase)